MDKLEHLSFEGDDGTGKLTAALATCAEIIRATDRTVLFISHPNYFGPGRFIRMMNRGKANSALDQLDGIELTKLRTAAYALDRVFSIIMLKPWLQENPDAVVVSDRGPFSNAVTVGIMLGNGNITEQDIPFFIEQHIPQLELELMQLLNGIQPILLATEKPNDTAIAQGDRESLDEYESMLDRTPVFESYTRLIRTEPVITRKGKDWVPATQTAATILERFGIEAGRAPSLSVSHRLHDYNMKGKFKAMGPDVLLKVLFGPEIEDRVTRVPYMWEHMAHWQNAILMDLNSPEAALKDAIIDNSEEIVAEGMFKIMNEYPVLNADIPPEASTAMHRLLTCYPELPEIVSLSLEGKGEGFVNMIKQIAALSQEA